MLIALEANLYITACCGHGLKEQTREPDWGIPWHYPYASKTNGLVRHLKFSIIIDIMRYSYNYYTTSAGNSD